MHPLHKTVGGRVESRRAGETDAAHIGQGVEQQRFELPALVSGDGLRASITGNPSGQEGSDY